MARGSALRIPDPESRIPSPGSRILGPGSRIPGRLKPIAVLKPLVFAAALLPAAALVVGFYQNDLTANPGDYITDQTGTWALAFLAITLSVTPLRRWSHWNDLIKLRRMLGLFAFFY